MTVRLGEIDTMLKQNASMTAALSERVAGLPRFKKPATKAGWNYRNNYCGGLIGVSLHKVLDA